MEADQRTKQVLFLALLNMGVRCWIIDDLEMDQKYLLSLETIVATLVLLVVQAKAVDVRVPRVTWRVPRHSTFLDQALLESYTAKQFKRRFRVKRGTFQLICQLLAKEMEHKDNRGGPITLEAQVAISLARLGTRNYLTMCGDLYCMAEGTASITVRKFCKAVEKVIKPIVIPKYTEESKQRMAKLFEEKHGIPFIMGAIDGSHIPIMAPVHDPQSYYNRKGFYSVILQGVADLDTTFWDWDIGWCGAVHDYTVFQHSKLGKDLIDGKHKRYKLIGDAAYPCRPYMYIPFKGSKDEMPHEQAFWNFIQSSTRMCIERAFGLLKGRWRMLLRRIEMPLEHITSIVSACVCLHNLCVAESDLQEDDFGTEALYELNAYRLTKEGKLKGKKILKEADYGLVEIARALLDVNGVMEKIRVDVQENKLPTILKKIDPNQIALLAQGTYMHRALANSLYRQHIKENSTWVDPCGAFQPSDEET